MVVSDTQQKSSLQSVGLLTLYQIIKYGLFVAAVFLTVKFWQPQLLFFTIKITFLFFFTVYHSLPL